MAILGSTGRAITQAVREAGETAVRTAMPGLTTAASTVTKLVKDKRDRQARALHEASEVNASNTVEEREFDYAMSRVKNFWRWNPWNLFLRVFRWIAPGFSNIEAHQAALTDLSRYANQNKANYFANEATGFMLGKVLNLSASGSLISRIFTSSDEAKGDPLVRAYMDAASAWMKSLDNNSDLDRSIIREHLGTLKSDSMPSFVRNELEPILEAKLQKQEQAAQNNSAYGQEQAYDQQANNQY